MTVAAALVLLAGSAGAAGPPSGPLAKCAVDAVVSGAGSMDKYEASVWRVPNPTSSAWREQPRRVSPVRWCAAATSLIVSSAGPLAVEVGNGPSVSFEGLGFHCAR